MILMASCGDDEESINFAPTFGGEIFTVSEATTDGAVIGMLNASDAEGDELTYSIISGNNDNLFALNGNALTVTTVANIDFNVDNYELTVSVADLTGSTTGLVVVDVDRAANLSPVFVGGVFELTENMANGTVLGTVMASDPEGADLTYEIASGNTGEAFAIGASNGELTINSMEGIDFETMDEFSLTVGVSDGTNSVQGLIVVNINDDVADNAQRFRITLYNSTNLFNTYTFNTPVGAAGPGPLADVDAAYSIAGIRAVPGTLLSFATMQVHSNDWFYAPRFGGFSLFNEAGEAVTGDITDQIALYDAGTEAENMAAWRSQDPTNQFRADDPNSIVRLIREDVTAEIRVELAFEAMSREFTLTITNINGGANPIMDVNPLGIVVSPGLVVTHAQPGAIFSTGSADRGNGLLDIAEDGRALELNNFFNAKGLQGNPIRLSTSYTNLSSAVGYTHEVGSNPLFTQGEPAIAGSGLEELAEDGTAQQAYDFLTGLGTVNNVSLATPETANGSFPVRAGESLVFYVEAHPGETFNFATMMIASNDWFVAGNNGNGITLFDENDNPISGISQSSNTYLYDAGTEFDELVGLGENQPPVLGTGNADPNTATRRVGSIDDQQFGKGVFNSAPGVTWSGDPRGGYNMVIIDIQPLGN